MNAKNISGKNGVIGTRVRGETGTSENAQTPPAPVALSPCPCGDAAVWYRPDFYRHGQDTGEGAGPALANMDVRHLSLCPSCFESAVALKEREGWMQVTPELANMARGQYERRFGRTFPARNADSQERHDPFAPPPLPDDW